MLDTFKFLLSVIKSDIEKAAEEYVEKTLYSEPYDFTQVVGYSGDNKQIRVIGPIVTIY